MEPDDFVGQWTKKYKQGITSESFARNVIKAFLFGKQGVKWVGGKLEQWSTSEELLGNPEKRKQELLRIVNLCGYDKKSEILNELKRRKVI